MITKICTKCGARWLFSNDKHNECPECDGELRRETNADRIRAMTDEELADFLCHIVSNNTVNCANCLAEDFCRMGRNGFKEWLKQEVEE